MGKLYYETKKLAVAFICLALNLTCEASTSDNVVNFINTYMRRTFTVIFGNSTNIEPILKVDTPKVLINLYENSSKSVVLDETGDYILVIDDLEELGAALQTLSSMKNWNSRKNYFLIFRKPTSKPIIKQSFSFLFKRKVFNSVAYYQRDTFYTWYPYSKPCQCGTRVHLVRVKNLNPFKKKIPKILQGCPLNVTWPKLDIFLWNPLNKTFPGAMFQFFNTIVRKMNVSVTYLENNTNFVGSQTKTGTYDVLEKDMVDRNIDLVLYCAINGDSFIQNLEVSQRFYQESYYFLLPSRRPYIRKNYVINMYQTSLVSSLAASIITSCFLWKLLTNRSITDSIFDTFQLSVQLFLNKCPYTSKSRLFFISFLVFLWCLNIAFQTRLSSVLTSPSYTPQIKTIHQLLLDSDVEVIRAFNNTLRTLYFVEEYRESLRKKWMVFPQTLRSVDLIDHFVRNRSEAIALSRVHLNHFKNPNKLHVLYQEPVTDLILVAGARKGFPLLVAINCWIYLLRERGLMAKYIQDSVSILRKFDFGNFVNEYSRIKLDMEHVEGPFVIWIVGVGISSIAFFIEIVVAHVKRRHLAINRRI